MGSGSAGERSLLETPWPAFDPELATSPRVTLVVQVNGRVRGRLDLERGAEESEAVARARDRTRRSARGSKARQIQRIVYVPDRLLNLVVQ